MTDAEILALNRVSPEMAAEYLDKNTKFIQCGLKQGRLPFGCAAECPGGKWSFHISPGLLVAYKRGTLNITLAPDRDAI